MLQALEAATRTRVQIERASEMPPNPSCRAIHIDGTETCRANCERVRPRPARGGPPHRRKTRGRNCFSLGLLRNGRKIDWDAINAKKAQEKASRIAADVYLISKE